MFVFSKFIKENLLAAALGVFALFEAGIAASEEVAIPIQRPENAVGEPKKGIEPATKPDLPRIYQSYCPILDSDNVSAEIAAPIDGGDCGEKSPIRLKEAHGIKVSSKTVMNCRMAMGFVAWLERVSKIADELIEEPISQVFTGPGYDCRRRNRKPDGKISEHGFANAVDVSGFKSSEGRMITLRDHFMATALETEVAEEADETVVETPPPSVEHLFLEALHKEACMRFSTVLGPNSGPNHRDHFHLDMGCHGKNCRYKICE